MKAEIQKIIEQVESMNYPKEHEMDIIYHLKSVLLKIDLMSKKSSVLDIAAIFCYVNEVEVDEFDKKTRKREVVDTRKMLIHYLRGERDSTLARYINKDRTTVIHYRKAVKDLLATDPDFKRRYEIGLAMLQV